MLENLGHVKTWTFLGIMAGMIRSQVVEKEHLDEEPDFHNDPVPGDSFPHHIFKR